MKKVTWQYLLISILSIVIFLGCNNQPSEKAPLYIDTTQFKEGVLILENTSKNRIITNSFMWEYVSLSMEAKDAKGKPIYPLPPPTPPIAIERYQIELLPNQKTTIPLKGLEQLQTWEQEGIKIRFKGNYSTNKDSVASVYSAWIDWN